MVQPFKLPKLTGLNTSFCLTISPASSSIINLHPSLCLNPTTSSLLNKGLNFIPTPSNITSTTTLSLSFKEFTRKLQWASVFKFKHSNSIPPFSLSNKTFPNTKLVSTDILQWCTDTNQTLSTYKITNASIPSSNLSSQEHTALKTLQKDSTIIIKPADKGGKLVIQHKDNYKQEALRQLHNTEFYKPIKTPIYLQTAKIITRIINTLRNQGSISKAQHRFLTPPDNPRPRHFYTLPKIHKDTNTWPVPHVIPPGRPIVSGCNSESAAVEQYIDYYLNPIASSTPSYLRDSTHLKAFLSQMHIKDTDILFTLDIESLYTNIPIYDGIQRIKEALTNNPQPKRPDNYILKLLEITLTRNDFQFDTQFFLQTKGTAMGKKYAPSFANIYMHFWEQLATSSFHLQPVFWKRYIDDIFGIWTHSEEQLLAFINHINSLNPNIKTSLTYNFNHINFLDCTIYKLNNKLATKLYSKPTDNHKLLHPQSFHPSHTFKGIIKAQILRYIKISSTHCDFQHSYTTLKHSLTQIGYTRNQIRRSKQEALQSTACSLQNMITGCAPCNKKLCQTCQHMNTTQTIYGNFSSDLYLITQNTSCHTRNCIYAIHCSLCTHIPCLYIGETHYSCRERISKHKSDIRHKLDKPVSKHFNSPNHSIDNLKVTVIQFLNEHKTDFQKTHHRRKLKENTWIKKLHTFTPHALNTQTTLHSVDIPLIFTYNKHATRLIRNIKAKLSDNATLKQHVNLIPAFSNNRNLKSILAPSKFR